MLGRAHAGLEWMSASGCTAVMVARDHETVGIIGVADEPRESAAAVVDMIRSQGVEHVVLLTGDHESAARALAGSLGISDYRASLLPEDKVAAVEELRRRYGYWQWSATASTMRPRSRPPTSASRWGWPAPTPRSRPPTSR